MTATEVATRQPDPYPAESPRPRAHIRLRIIALISVVTMVIASIALGIGFSLRAPPGSSSADTAYSYYQSVMGRYPGSMMGGSMMGSNGYRWITGGAAAPGWMRGANLPPPMMRGATDPGEVMGRLWADAPGTRISPAEASRLGDETPAGATVDTAADSISFSSGQVHLVILASPRTGPDETFRAAGLTNPSIAVPTGAEVTVEIINADPDTAHGVVITGAGTASAWMPMMTAVPAFPGSELWFLADPTSAGMHAGTFSFTAATAGTYSYLCPVPGHAQKGMDGTFQVR